MPVLGFQGTAVRRREFITLLGGVTAAWPLVARAQQPAMPVIGFLNSASPIEYAPFVAAFRRGLKEASIIEGQNATVEYRWAEDQYDQLPALVADLIHREVLVIVATSTPAARAAKDATATIPIVFTTADDPIKLGFVVSLNRPSGNMTGVANLLVELGSKQLGLLRELAPGTTAIAVLMNPNFLGTERQLKDVEASALALGLQFKVFRATTKPEIDNAFVSMAQLAGAALVVAADPFLIAQRDHIVALAARYTIPAIYSVRNFAVAGGVMSYGTDVADAYRLAGMYTARIVRGEKPADLPVWQSTKFEFVINLKAAKALGLAVPPTLLAQADEVIE
jgi:putative tryptophan/tyrosine transport system substrate-binding protein